MAYVDPQLLHLDSMLSGVSVGYKNDDLVGDNLFPTVRVNNQSNKYYVLEKIGFTIFDDLREPGTEANELPPMSLSRDSYFAEEHSLRDKVPNEERDNADNPLDPMIDATERLTDTILLNRENAINSMVTTTGNYATGHTVTLAGTQQWSDYTNSTPIVDSKVARDKIHADTLKKPSILILGYDVGTKLEDHPSFLDRIKYSQLGVTTWDIIAQVIGLSGRIMVAGAAKNTANVGQTVALANLWGKVAIFAFVPPTPGRKTPAFAYEYVWPYPGGIDMPTERWYNDDVKATRIRTSRRYDLKFAAVDTVASGKATGGYLINAAIA